MREAAKATFEGRGRERVGNFVCCRLLVFGRNVLQTALRGERTCCGLDVDNGCGAGAAPRIGAFSPLKYPHGASQTVSAAVSGWGYPVGRAPRHLLSCFLLLKVRHKVGPVVSSVARPPQPRQNEANVM